MSGEGEAGEQGGAKGDLYIYISVRNHPIFQRDENDIYMEQEINVAQAALGAEIQVPTLEGKVSLTIPAGVQSGAKFRIRGKGVKSINTYTKGDQYVIVRIVTPKNLTSEQKELFRTSILPIIKVLKRILAATKAVKKVRKAKNSLTKSKISLMNN